MNLTFMTKDRPQTLLFDQLTCQLISQGYGFRFEAKGRSMLPTICDGEILHVQTIGTKRLRRGDIVLLKSRDVFKAHRIIQQRGTLFMTRGDAGIEPDIEIPRDSIIGLVIAKELRGRSGTVRLHGFMARVRFFLNQARRRIRLVHAAQSSTSAARAPFSQ